VDLLSDGSPELSQDIALGMAWAFADRSPELAAELLGSRLRPDTDLPEDIPRQIGDAWIARDPDAAMTWLASLPAGPARDRILRSTYLAWLGRNRSEAMSWMASHLDSTGDGIEPALEPAMDVYARVSSRDDPEGAMALAQRLSDDQVREDAEVAILEFWWFRDRDAADAWMDAAGVTMQQRQAVERAAARRQSRRGLAIGRASAPGDPNEERDTSAPAGDGP